MRKRSVLALSLAIFGAVTLTGSAQVVRSGHDFHSHTWSHSSSAFGGFSGIEVSEDGKTFVVINDRGLFAQGKFVRENGKLTAIDWDGALRRLRLVEGKRENDAEGLAMDRRGRVWVSYERRSFIRRHGATEIDLPQHRDFHRFPPNGGLEALAIDGKGRLHALPERFRYGTDTPVYRLDRQTWQVVGRIPRDADFLTVGADFGPEGALYVLDRAFTGIGFRSRVRRIDTRDWSVETLFETLNGTHDNLEGLAVWRDTLGKTRLTMISDDNFRFFQKTEFVEYTLPD